MNVFQKLWLLPLFVHIGYFTGTVPFFFGYVGNDNGTASTVNSFALHWAATVLVSNLLLAGILLALPHLPLKILGVPGRPYWSETTNRRAELNRRLGALMATLLLTTNLFFLGIYQLIYQTNVTNPVIELPNMVVGLLFVVAPMSAGMAILLRTLLMIKKQATKGD